MSSCFFSVVLITSDLLRLIFERMALADLARAACVCRLWKEVASDRALIEGAFRRPWKVRRMIGSPSSDAFWRRGATLDRFAISHRLAIGESVVGLAVKYSVQENQIMTLKANGVIEIKRLNNMMSEHGIYSRERLLIPISDPELLHNSTCFIELDDHAKREVAVLYLEGNPHGISVLPSGGFTTQRGSRKLVDSVKRSLQVDDETAAYYLSVSNGDPRNAILQFSEDLRLEQQRGRNL